MSDQDLNVVGRDVARLVLALMVVSLSTVASSAAAPATPGPQYGYCSARTADEKKVYVSAVFEMPMADIQEHNRVMNAEFNKVLAQKYGSPSGPNEARSGGCTVVWNVPKAKAEEMLQIIVADAHQHNAQLFDTGWTFVRTAQTPPPGPPVGGH